VDRLLRPQQDRLFVELLHDDKKELGADDVRSSRVRLSCDPKSVGVSETLALCRLVTPRELTVKDPDPRGDER